MSAPRRRPPTIIDVARQSGVSKSTVSNVIRGIDGRLSAATRARVEQAMAELGYRPNALARDLKRQRTATIGVVVGDLTNPFFSDLTQQIEHRLAAAGYAAIIACDSGKGDRGGRGPFEVLLEQRVSGILVLHLSEDTAALGDLGRSVPIVLVSTTSRRADCVATDDARGATLAAGHLISLGHRRVAYVSAPGEEPSSTAARERGWRNALRRAALPRGRSAVWRPREETEVNALLAELGNPTAIIANNDLSALRVVDDLERAGHAVPERVSVVGFDDIAITRLRRLALTTVRQPVDELARRGTALLFDRIDRGTEADFRRIRLDPTLMVRATTGPPPLR